MNRYSLSLNFAFTLKVRLFLFFSKVHTSYSYNYILSCKETYPQPQFSIVGQCFALLKQLQDGGTQIPLPKVCLDYQLNGQSFYLFVFLSCVFLWVFFQQTKKYILNLKALVNLGITCSETLTNFIVCKFNEILGSTNVKLSRLGHVELCKDYSTRIPCIHGFTTQSKIKGEKTNLGSGGQKQPVAKIHSVRRILLMTTFSQYAATIVCKPTNLNIIRESCMSNILQPLLSHAVLHKTHFWIIYSGLV